MAIESNGGTSVIIGGIKYVYFGGTNYLGLAHRPELMEAASRAFTLLGFSAGASRLTSGESELLVALEEYLAAFGRSQASLVLPAGYMSNLAVVEALDDLIDGWLIQINAHGSIKFALKQSRKPIYHFDSKDQLETIAQRRAQIDSKRLGIFIEPIEPLTGNVIDLHCIEQAKAEEDFLILDEAHSFGILGKTGRGAQEQFELSSQKLIRTGTFSKAIGTQGGFVLAEHDVIASILEKSTAVRSSTPLSPVLMSASLRSLMLLEEKPDTTIEKLRTNLRILTSRLEPLGVTNSFDCPIFYLGGLTTTVCAMEALKESFVYVPQVGNYFGSNADIGLRWTVQANHTVEELELLSMLLERSAAIEGTSSS